MIMAIMMVTVPWLFIGYQYYHPVPSILGYNITFRFLFIISRKMVNTANTPDHNDALPFMKLIKFAIYKRILVNYILCMSHEITCSWIP